MRHEDCKSYDPIRIMVNNHQQGKPLLNGVHIVRGSPSPEQSMGSLKSDGYVHGTLLTNNTYQYARFTRGGESHHGYIGFYAIDDSMRGTRVSHDYGLESGAPCHTLADTEKALEPYVARLAAANGTERDAARRDLEKQIGLGGQHYEIAIPTMRGDNIRRPDLLVRAEDVTSKLGRDVVLENSVPVHATGNDAIAIQDAIHGARNSHPAIKSVERLLVNSRNLPAESRDALKAIHTAMKNDMERIGVTAAKSGLNLDQVMTSLSQSGDRFKPQTMLAETIAGRGNTNLMYRQIVANMTPVLAREAANPRFDGQRLTQIIDASMKAPSLSASRSTPAPVRHEPAATSASLELRAPEPAAPERSERTQGHEREMVMSR